MEYRYILKITLAIVFGLFTEHLLAQVTVGNVSPPAKAALLQIKDIEPTNPATDNTTVGQGGLLLPRVALEDLKKLAPLVSESDLNYAQEKILHTGTMVYNTEDDMSKQLYPGIHIWDGSTWSFVTTAMSADFTLAVNKKELIYPSGQTPQAIQSQSATATWNPISARCSFSLSPLLNGGISVNGGLPAVVTGGNYTFNILLNPMTTTEVTDSPFLEKVSTLNVTSNDGGAIKTEKLILRQTHYSLLPANFESRPELNKSYTAKIRSNTNWKAVVTSGAGLFVNFTANGAANTVLGTDFNYTLSDNDLLEGTSATITFYSVDAVGVIDNKIDPVAVTFIAKKDYPNTYLVKPGATFEFPIRKAYNVWDKELNLPLSGAVTVGLVWQDAKMIESLALANGDEGVGSRIKVTTKAGVSGNALVYVNVGGELRWTWQLWLTDYDPDDIQSKDPGFDTPNQTAKAAVAAGDIYGYYNGAKKTVFMDRYLGAGSPKYTSGTGVVGAGIGCLYQWGRFAPLVSSIALGSSTKKTVYDIAGTIIPSWTLTGVTESNNLKNAIQNPTIFYIGALNNNEDWYSNVVDIKNDYLWSDQNGFKTVFDPCPYGWRVMSAGSGSDNLMLGSDASLTLSNNTYDFSGQGLGYWTDTSHVLSTGVWVVGAVALAARTQAGAHRYVPYLRIADGLRILSYPRSWATPIRCVQDDK